MSVGEFCGGSWQAGFSTLLHCPATQNSTGTRFRFVPYRGAAPAIQDVLAGRIDLTNLDASVLLPHVRDGKKEQQTPEALGAWQRTEIEEWWPMIKAANIKAEYRCRGGANNERWIEALAMKEVPVLLSAVALSV
jgi:Tripartite tricarboxylate transporter family receptor